VRKRTTIFEKIVLSVLAALMLTSVAVSGTSVASVTERAALGRYDYADPASPSHERALKASEFLSLLTGEKISDAEARYVDSMLSEALLYTDSVPVSKVTVKYDGETVYVSAESYSYVSESGAAVEWLPDKIKLGNSEAKMTYSVESGRYEGALGYATADGGNDPVYVNVEYSFALSVSGQDADTYRNYAYERAVQISHETEDYELALAAYNSYVDYLEAMKVYEPALDAYEKYVSDKAIYDKALAKYEKYLSDKSAYDDRLDAYNKYVGENEIYKKELAAYQDYLNAKATYEDSKLAYDSYRAVVEKATAKLAVIENAFVSNSKQQVLYSTLWGPTVGEVVGRQDELVNVGKCDPQDIINAGDSTERLRLLLKGYNECADLPSKYAYYVENYESIKSDFILLYRSLRQLYENEAVYAGIVSKNRLERYVEFLSHLYVLQSCFDDEYTIDESWTVKKEFDNNKLTHNYYSYKEILDECQIPIDTDNSSPNDLKAWPAEVKDPGNAPEAVAVPKQPTAVADPGLAPDEVDEPTEPAVVEKPTKPQYAAPAEKPEAVTYTSAENAIFKAYKDGELTRRTQSGGVTISLTSSCSKLVPIGDRYLVTFYDDDAKTVIYQYYASYRETVAYSGDVPQKASTDKYSYTFNGWRDANGDRAAFGEVTEKETVFYASYKRAINVYKVTWKVNGVETVEDYEYGQLPSYKGSTSKPYDERYRYSFAGWSQPIDTVTGDAVYEALYESIPRKYEIIFKVDGNIRSEQYEYGELPQYKYSTDKAPNDTYIYQFKGWDKEIEAVTGNAEYTAVYEAIVIVSDGEGNPLSVQKDDIKYSVTTSDNEIRSDRVADMCKEGKLDVLLTFLSGECSVFMTPKAAEAFSNGGGAFIGVEKGDDGTYTLKIMNSDRAPVELGTSVSLFIKSDSIDEYTMVYSVDADGKETKLTASRTDGGITVKLSAETVIVFKQEYSITVNDIENGVVTSTLSVANPGERVKLEVSIDDAFLLTEVTVVGDISGDRYALDAENSLIMPDEPITVSATVSRKVFTVTFISDGQVVSVREYFKGDIIEKPADPTKEGDGVRIYKFIEWDPLFSEGATANADATYTAVFKELLVENQQGFVPEEDNRFLTFVITVVSVFIVLLAALITTIVIIMKKNKKKRRDMKMNKTE